MYKIRIVFSILLFLLGAGSQLWAQENIVLRTDRNLYVAGEPMWIELDCKLNGSNTTSALSTVAYIELLNANNTPVLQKCLSLESGSAGTRLFIPDSIKTGNYIFRAYTRWMQNYNPNLYAHKTISVVNPFKFNKFPKSDIQFSEDTVFFYPEGEKLLQNQPNSLVLQMLNKHAQAICSKVYLVSENKDTVGTFTTNSMGFANIEFTPKNNVSYWLNYSNNGTIISQKVPEALHSGAVLSLKTEHDKIILEPLLSGNYAHKKYTIDIINSRGDFVKSIETKALTPIVLNKKELPNGYLCAKLFDNSNKLTASRYFVANGQNNAQHVNLQLAKQSFSTREKVSLHINELSHLKNVSIAVSPSVLVKKQAWISNPTTINDYSLSTLTAFTGNGVSINNVLQCFKPVQYVKRPDLQLNFLPEHKGKLLTGTLVGNNNRAIAGETLILNIVGKQANLDMSTTDSKGRFRFLINQYGDKEVVIQPLLQTDTTQLKYTIDFDETYSNQYAQTILPMFVIPKNEVNKINKAIINMQISTIYNTYNTSYERQITEGNKKSFYGQAEHTMPISKFIELSTMTEIIKELVPFTFLHNKKGKSTIAISEPDGLNRSEGEPFLMADGVYIKDIERILQIPAENAERIELINLNYYFKGKQLGRILAFYTLEGNLSSIEFDDNIFRQAQAFYEFPATYKATTYDEKIETQKNQPDFRNLLFWKTNVTDSHIEFYTSDNKADYTIVATGINNEGQIETYQTHFNVK